MKVSAKTKEKPTPVSVEYDLPEKLPEMIKKFNEDVVAAAAKAQIVIVLQAFMRRHIDKGTSHAEIQKEVSAWRPDVRTVVKQSAFEKVTSSLDKLTPEERRKLLEQLRQKAA
ncbi:MAG: hypothetical protein ACYDB1_00685 [Acidiferrobacteraceae bacterium]